MTTHYVSPVRHAWEYPSYVYIISILYGYIRYCRTDWVGKTLRQNRKNGIQIRASQLVKTCKVFSLWFEFPNRGLQPTTPKKTSHIYRQLRCQTCFQVGERIFQFTPYSFLILFSRCYNKNYLSMNFPKKNNKICSYHIISYLAPFVWWDVMKKFLDTNIMFHNNQGSKPIHGRWRAKPRANLSKTHHPRFHLWICLATRWVGMFLETWKGRNYICKYMDGWSLWKGQNHSKYQKCHECLKFFHIKLNKKKWYFETHRYFFRVFSECTNNLLIVPHWWTIPYDLGMVRLDAKSSKSQGWSIFPSLPASKVSLAAAGAQRCAPMNWRRVDGC